MFLREDGYWNLGEPETSLVLVCPRCGFDYNQPGRVLIVNSADDYSAAWGGRGSLRMLEFHGECGHSWALCFGFHKGQVRVFVRQLTAEANPLHPDNADEWAR